MTTRDGRVSDGDGVVLRPTGSRDEPAPGVGMLGLTVLLISLSVLFIAGIVAYIVVRNGQPVTRRHTHAEIGCQPGLFTRMLHTQA